jgi:hypothetical protein
MQPDRLISNREPEPNPSGRAAASVVNAVKGTEYLFQGFIGHAGPGIRHSDQPLG